MNGQFGEKSFIDKYHIKLNRKKLFSQEIKIF